MYSKRRKKHPTRRERYERRQAKRYAVWKENHPNPTPYHDWPEYAGWMRGKIQASLDRDPALPSWLSNRRGAPQLLTADDLAVGLWAVRCTQKKGTSYGQMRCYFRVCLNQNCHDAKVTAIFTELQRRKLIAQTGFYCPGKRGNVFVAVDDPDTYFITYQPPTPISKEPRKLKASVHGSDQSPGPPMPDADDQPFG